MKALQYEMDSYQVVIFGCGGTGSALVNFLARFAYSCNSNILITLVDNDTVEPKNVLRQNFSPQDVGKNKAKALAQRYMNTLGIKMCYREKYIESSWDAEQCIFWDRYPIIVGCLDNTTARKHLDDLFQGFGNMTYLDAGNGHKKGQVVYGLQHHSCLTLKPVGYYFPDLVSPEEDEPEGYTMGCADTEQTMNANWLSAHILFSYLSNLLSGKETRHMTFFDASDMNIVNKAIEDCPDAYLDAITGYQWLKGINLVDTD